MPPLHPLRLHPLAQPLPSAPRPFAAASVPHTHLFPRPPFSRISPKTGNSPLPSDLLWQAPPLLFAPSPSPIPQPLTPYAPRRPPGSRRESPHSRPSLLLPLPPPPESNEPAPHSRGIPPRAAPPASTSRSAPRRLPERPQFGKTSLPALQSPALRPVPSPAASVPHLLSAAPSLRPQSRNLQPPALEPPSVSPCSRPASPAPRPADLPGVRLRQASCAALRACVSRVSPRSAAPPSSVPALKFFAHGRVRPHRLPVFPAFPQKSTCQRRQPESLRVLRISALFPPLTSVRQDTSLKRKRPGEIRAWKYVVPRDRIELPTRRFSVPCSTN